jgi:Ca2+-binding EF-hand superfamily protein
MLQLLQVFNAVEEKKITGSEARDIIATFDKYVASLLSLVWFITLNRNKDGTINFEEFVEVIAGNSYPQKRHTYYFTIGTDTA